MTLTDKNGSVVYGFAGTSTITICPGSSYSNLLTPGATTSRLRTYFNKSAICPAPVIGSDGSTGYGNTGVGIVRGPGRFNTDVSIGKITTVGGLREYAQFGFRTEFYNARHHPQFANPGTIFGTSGFGVITRNLRGFPADPIRLEVYFLRISAARPLLALRLHRSVRVGRIPLVQSP